MRRKVYRRSKIEGWPPSGFARFKDDVSSGPSRSDPGLGGFLSGGTDYSAFAPAPNAASGFNAGVGAPTLSSSLAATPAAPMASIGASGSFTPDSSAMSGVGTQQQNSDVFDPISGSPPVNVGPPPIDAIGSTGPATVPDPVSGLSSQTEFGGTPVDAFGSTGPAQLPGASSGGGSSTLSAKSASSAAPGSASVGGGEGIPSIGPSSIDDLLSKLGQGAMNSFTKNPIGLLAGGIPLLSQLMNKPKIPQQQNFNDLASSEKALANQQQSLGTALSDPLISGKLPAGQEQSVQNAINDAVSTTKARYANLGLTGSTMEADAVANIQNQATGLRAQIEQQMAQTGQAALNGAASAFGLQDQVYAQLMQAQVSQDNALSQALARFAGAASGAPQNLNIKLGQQ